ncbi:hypothetical protein AB0I10_35740 [Streptomyces sp. NPDC050636]|uniref:hypothetical protein n=1 Tax=Streptomyces sp. NPDC050636 TaxID=3154510 RepID=UPI00343BBFB6
MAPAHESPCQMMRRLAKAQGAEIGRTEKRIDELRKKIGDLQAQPVPDAAAIAALRQAAESLEKKLEDDRLSLSTLEDVITENC